MCGVVAAGSSSAGTSGLPGAPLTIRAAAAALLASAWSEVKHLASNMRRRREGRAKQVVPDRWSGAESVRHGQLGPYAGSAWRRCCGWYRGADISSSHPAMMWQKTLPPFHRWRVTPYSFVQLFDFMRKTTKICIQDRQGKKSHSCCLRLTHWEAGSGVAQHCGVCDESNLRRA